MAEFTAVGPALNIDGPPPVAPPQSLLNTPGVVVAQDATRVLNGVNVWGYPSDCPSLWEPCSDGTFRLKNDDSDQPTPRFDSFVVYQPITCSSISMGDPDEFRGRAEAVLAATISSGVEEAMAAGVTGSSNPHFGDAAVDVLNSGTAVTPRIGVSFLEQAIGDSCRLGMIHLTPAVIAGLPAPFTDEQGSLMTANGTPVVSGMGYQGVDTPYLTTPSAKQDWIFATGPVQVYLGPLIFTDIKETLDRSDNTVTFRAERYVVALWDTAVQAAVLVDWST